MSTVTERLIDFGRVEGIQEGRQKGIQEGRQKGMQEGRQKGMQEGRQKGIQENTIETAKRMLKENLPIELISRMTKLSIEEAEKLKESLNN